LEGRWEPKECHHKIEGQKEADVFLEYYKIRLYSNEFLEDQYVILVEYVSVKISN